MSGATDKRTLVTACMRVNGTPTFAMTDVSVTPEEAENGVHFYLAELQLQTQGFEEPYVHFDQSESPAFLFPAVRQFLDAESVVPDQIIHALSEN
jgi:hypothetical protein